MPEAFDTVLRYFTVKQDLYVRGFELDLSPEKNPTILGILRIKKTKVILFTSSSLDEIRSFADGFEAALVRAGRRDVLDA